MRRDDEVDIDRLSSRDPGADEDDPYRDVDLDDLPEWWRRAVVEFEVHGLRPYRPPRLEDGTYLHEIVEDIETELGVSISFGAIDDDYRERWALRVDGERVGKVGRRRSPDGYTVFEIDDETLRDRVRTAAEQR